MNKIYKTAIDVARDYPCQEIIDILSKRQFKATKQKKKEEPIPAIKLLSEDEVQNLDKLEELGSGGSGRVYKVAMKKIYALKQMIITKANFKNLRNFMSEYEIMNLLHHPNVLKVFGILMSSENILPCILLEYCPMNLEKGIEEKMFSNEEIVKIIYQIIEGMKYIHFKKIIHRDIKPSNILIASDGIVRISDFGISKLMSTRDQSMTLGIGSQKYMAPEIINEEDHYDEKVDVYSFGVLVFFVLSGGKIPNIKIGEILNGKKAEIPSSFTDFSKKLISDCWNFKSKDRPSFSAILERLIKSNYNLLPLKNNELKGVKAFVKLHKTKIPFCEVEDNSSHLPSLK